MKHLPFEFITFFEAAIILLLIAAIAVIITKYKDKKNHERHLESRTIISQVLIAIVNAIEAKDPYTSGHSLRVAEYSIEIARRMGMSKGFLENLYYIGLLHDVGKIGIPKEILRKPDKLTREEYDILKTHSNIGREILQNITAIANLPIGAAEHHERWDGKGYYQHISGNNISLEARIIGAADTYDAMSSDRSYRKALPKDVIFEEFKRCSGKQFDPKIASIVIEMIEQDQFGYIDVNKTLGFEQIHTVNKIGTYNGFDYELYKNEGDAEMILTGGGNFRCKWENCNNITFRMGKKFDETKTHSQIGKIEIKYGAKYHPKSKSEFIGTHGWFVNPLVLFYIADDSCHGTFKIDTFKGKAFIDGGTYSIYETLFTEAISVKGTQTFKMYTNIRDKKRTSGVISITEHFKSWENLGMALGNLFEVSLTVGGLINSSGSAEIYQNEMTIGNTIIRGV